MFDSVLLAEQASHVAALDASSLTDAELFDGVVGLEQARARLDAAECAMLAELHSRDATDRHHGLRTKGWLSRNGHASPRTAGTRVSVAVTLRRVLDVTAAALADGRIGFDHAQVMARACNPRIETGFAEMQQMLLELVPVMVFDRWRREVFAIADLLDQDGGHDPSDDVESNRLRMRSTGDNVFFDGQLCGEHGLVTESVIESVTDELWRRYRDDHTATDGAIDIPSRATLRALALVEICRRAAGNPEPDAPSPGAEATLVIPAEQPDITADRYGTRRDPGALACDLRLHPVIVNSLGVPLDMGRQIRLANQAQRRALALRDGGCCFPGCDRPPQHCDAHHIDHWTSDLGRTDVAHMALFCRHHHGVIHRHGWGATIDTHGRTTITTPHGHTLTGQQHGRQRAGPPRAGP
ncbi:MAG: DUF222 domain-containing protein [Microthrixaceae bacterium]